MKAKINLDLVRAEIGSMVDEIVRLQTALASKGIDASDPDDAEVFEIIERIERSLLQKRGSL